MRIRGQFEGEWLTVLVGEHPVVDDRCAMPIVADNIFPFHPTFRQTNIQRGFLAEDEQARAAVAKRNLIESDPVTQLQEIG